MTKNEITWLEEILEQIRPARVQLLSMSFFVNLLALASPIFVLQVYDRVVFHAGLATLNGLVLGMFLVMLFDFVLRQGRAHILHAAGVRINVQLGKMLFERLLAIPFAELERKPASFWHSFFRDVEMIRARFSGPLAMLLLDIPFMILAAGLIVSIATPVAWVVGLAAISFTILALVSGNRQDALGRKEQEYTLKRDAIVTELSATRTTIKSQSLDRVVKTLWSEKHADWVETSLSRSVKADLFRDIGQSMVLITTVMMTTVGALAILKQELSIGSLIAANMLSGRLVGPLFQLVIQWQGVSQYKQARERLNNLFNLPVELAKSSVQFQYPEGIIRLENVSYRYEEEGPYSVRGLSGQIGPGGLHALVGANGSGKSTLLKLIRGLYPLTEGRIFLDGADIVQFSRSDLGQWIGYLPQQIQIFSGNIRDNITMHNPEASDQEIIKAATLAGAHEFIKNLPDGYGTEIGEAGFKLSGGERKRIALAGVLLCDPPVLVLDEPSSDLDPVGEEQLRNNLLALSKTHTIIIVSHRPGMLKACAGVVVLDKGRLQTAGTALEVLPGLGVKV
jgi:ATP-binding cassette, subfamily C, bacterial LapB